MKHKLLPAVALIIFCAAAVFAQKAEPNRIAFAKGKSSAVKTGGLKSGETYEYVFGAKQGQKIKLKIVSTAPQGKFHYFTLRGDRFDFVTEYDKNYDFEFTAPKTGDYLLDVNFNAAGKVTAGKFSLTLTITN